MSKSHDLQGKEYAKISELEERSVITLDGSFSCRSAGAATVHRDAGGLYFTCDEGKHYLSGQCGNGMHCVGVYLV